VSAGRSRRAFPATLGTVWLVWLVAMSLAGAWGLYLTRWPMALTMVFGSFVAGSTPAGGGAVAFPVFTKLLEVGAREAALFGLMIQAVGMSMASLFIVTRGIAIDTRVWRWSLLGAAPGVMLGLALLRLPENLPRLGFSCLLLVFAITLYRSHWRRKHRPEPRIAGWGWRDGLRFAGVGVAGGLLASQLGSGADMLCFMVMTLGYGLDERVAVPTSVVLMGSVSVLGFGFRLLLAEPIGEVWEYWAVAAPVVAVGAPLGAWVASRASGDRILAFIFALVAIEVVSTALLIPIDAGRAAILVAVMVGAGLWFWRLRCLRRRRLG